MQHIKRMASGMASVVLILALLISVLPLDSIVWATSTEAHEPVTEAAAETPAEAATTEAPTEPEPAPEPTGTETTAVTAEPAPEPATEESPEVAAEAATEESPEVASEPATEEAEASKAAEPSRDPATGYGRPTGTIEELEAVPVPDEILANSYVLLIPVILYGTTTFSVSFKYPNDPNQTTYTTNLSGFRYHYLNGQMAYCLEPQASTTTNAVYSQIAGGADLNVWDRFLSDSQRNAIALALAYGAPNGLNSATTLTLHGYEAATQVIIWELIVGYRNTVAPFNCTNSRLYEFVLSLCNPNENTGTLRAAYISGYNSIISSMQSHGVIPSFASTKQALAPEYEMAYDAASGLYKIVLTDSNNAINNDFPYANGNGLTFTKSGNRLTVTATAEALRNQPVLVSATGSDPDTDNVSPVIWGATNSNHHEGQILSQMAKPDKVKAFFRLKRPQDATVSLKKTTEGSADVLKCIENNPLYTLSGAVYEIHKDSPTGEITETLTTNASGEAFGSRKYNVGTVLYAVEKTAPKGYLLDSTPVKLTVAASGNVFHVKDKPTFDPAALQIKKTGQDGTKIAGAVFKAEFYASTWADEDHLLRTWYLKSDSDGYVVFKDASLTTYDGKASDPLFKPNGANNRASFPLGCVVVTEVKTAPGYVLPTSGDSVCIFVRQGGGITSVNGAAAGAYWGNEKANPLDSAHPKGIYRIENDSDKKTLTATNEPSTVSVSLKKTTAGNADVLACIQDNPMYTLKGAVYEIHKDSPTGEITETLTTNASGEAFGSRKYNVGTVLYAVEKTAPKGYLLDSTPVKLTVAVGGNVFNVKDTPTFSSSNLKIVKKSVDGKPIAGAVFRVQYYAENYRDDSKLMRTWYLKSDANGDVCFDNAHLASGYTSDPFYKPGGEISLPLGFCYVLEVATAPGYVLLSSGRSVNLFITQGGKKPNEAVRGAAAGAYWGDASANPLTTTNPKGIYKVENDADKKTLTATNTPLYGKPFDVKKIDPNGASLKDAIFKVVYYADSWCNPEKLEKTWYFATDKNGYFTLEAKYLASGYESSSLYATDKIPLGLMVVSEEVAPTGFQKALFNGVWRIRQKEAGSPDVESYWAESNGYTPTDNYGSNVYILEEEPDTLYVKNKPIPGTGAMFKTVDAGAPEGYTPELPSPEGYCFNLFRPEDSIAKKKTWYGKSDADGKVYLTDEAHSTIAPGDRDYTFTGLYDGTYALRELIASAGITDNLWPSQIEITTSGGTTAACHYVIPDAANGLILANKDGDCVVSNLKLTGLNGGGSLTIKIKNKFTPPPPPAKGSLKLIKYEKGTQKPLKDAGFRLFDYEENQIAEKFTDANGEILFEDLDAEVAYFYQEFQAPEGYELDDTMYSFSLTEENLNIVKIAENTPEKSSLKIVKQSDDGNVANITFTIKDGDTVIYTGKTNRSGVLNVKNKLTIGKTYTVVETVPENYVSDNRTQTFVAQSGTNVLTFVNHPIVKLKVIKQSDDGNVANIQFTVKDGDEVIWQGVTEDNGELLIEDLLTLGKTYTVIETVPENYVSGKRVQEFTAKIGLNVLTFVNHPVVKLKVVKQSDDGNVANIAFTVKDGDEVIWEGVTEDNGELLIEDLLTLGKTYTVIETVPKNYVSEKREQTFVAKLGTTTLTFINHPVVKLKVIKQSDDGNVANIPFTVKDGDEVIWEGVTEDNGELLIEDLLTLGKTYTVIETVPENYVSEKRVQKFTAKIGLNVLTFVNHPVVKLKVVKQSDDGNVANIPFKVKDGDAVIWEGVTEENGELLIENLLTLGKTYTVIEIVPENYVSEKQEQTFVAELGTNVLTFVNHPLKGSLKLIKYESGTQKPLKDAGFRLFDSEKTQIAEKYTDANGEILFDGLYAGVEYFYQEFQAPDGYELDDTMYSFSLNKENLDIEIACENTIKEGTIRIRKINEKGQPMSGVRFLLEFSVNDGRTWLPIGHRSSDAPVTVGCCINDDVVEGVIQTGADGWAEFAGLAIDNQLCSIRYRLTEVKTRNGCELLASPIFDGHLTAARTEREFTAVNHSAFQLPMTGGAGFTGLGIGFSLSMLASVLLLLFLPKKREKEN